ncbi:hypothetical protein LJR130_003037 [Variovorax sp. LjRoot130]
MGTVVHRHDGAGAHDVLDQAQQFNGRRGLSRHADDGAGHARAKHSISVLDRRSRTEFFIMRDCRESLLLSLEENLLTGPTKWRAAPSQFPS